MNRPQPILILLLALLALSLLAQIVPLYTDWLWFGEVGYVDVFVKTLSLRGALFAAMAIGVLIFLYANLTFAARTAPPDVIWELEDQLGLPGRVVIEPLIRRFMPIVLALISLAAGMGATVHWESVLGYFNATPFGSADPLFGLLVLGALALGLKAIGFWLDRFDLVFSPRGIVFGAAYSDIYASLPVLGALAVFAALCGVACLAQIARSGLRLVAGGLIALTLVWVLGLGIYPALLQRFRVTPNELAAERPFIGHNIRMTRAAYGLDRIVEREFPADEALDARALERNGATIKNIRLWDYRPLLRTFGQLQEIRTYYKFVDVDNDRYVVNGEYRQLMLSPRELSYQHLQSPGFINERLTYTHGYGAVVGPVNRVTAEGLPELLVKDIPPQSASGFPKITRPQIYYGEQSNEYVLVKTRSQELDYPSGDQNVYTTYNGSGGIPISSFVRKVAFAVRFGEIKLLLSNDLTDESRIMMHRAVARRVRQIAPFFRYDRDPYLVIGDDGRMIWLLDGYTTTDRYPYSDPVAGMGNYIRNSVKVAIDAYDGSVSFYLADPTDPIVRAYASAFPTLLKPIEQMPEGLRRHIRYPEDLFAIQARKYATYHMLDPQVFYNKEDLWAVPRRTIEGRDRDMEPYFTIMRLPGEQKEEFMLLTLFNPARRDNMIAWMAGRSDPPNYGRLIVYNFPKQKLVYGPRQIDARIDQDPIISQQLSLWNQRGSSVIRGSLLAIPIDQSLIYVQPLYLAASEQGALPELRRVIVAYGNQIAMEQTLEQSLSRIFGGRPATAVAATSAPSGAPADSGAGTRQQLAQHAWEIWTRAQDALRRGDWTGYGAEQKRLEEALRALTQSK
ncbi:MAG: UPF0182 family protein [Candidatus Rokuibacteriota bacterium]|nr:MAG: UPF0182 family protein [Candidatus Rokubacteria bacterium]